MSGEMVLNAPEGAATGPEKIVRADSSLSQVSAHFGKCPFVDILTCFLKIQGGLGDLEQAEGRPTSGEI